MSIFVISNDDFWKQFPFKGKIIQHPWKAAIKHQTLEITNKSVGNTSEKRNKGHQRPMKKCIHLWHFTIIMLQEKKLLNKIKKIHVLGVTHKKFPQKNLVFYGPILSV